MVATVRIKADNARGYKIVNADDPRAKQPVTREDIAKMKRGEVVELLEAHGYDGHEGKKLPECRAALTEIMFFGDA